MTANLNVNFTEEDMDTLGKARNLLLSLLQINFSEYAIDGYPHISNEDLRTAHNTLSALCAYPREGIYTEYNYLNDKEYPF